MCRGRANLASPCESSLLLQHSPVKSVVILVIQGAEQDPEQLPQIHVIRAFLESQAPAVVEVHGKLSWEAFAQNLNGSGHLFLADFLVLLLFGGSLQALPGQRTPRNKNGFQAALYFSSRKRVSYLLKYINTYPSDSISSLRDCSMPKCALMLAYRAVPVKFLSSL